MDRRVLESRLAEQIGITKQKAKLVLEAITGAITSGLVDDGRVILKGFGVFHVADSKAKTMRNPRTGAQVDVGPRKRIRFRPAKALKEIANKECDHNKQKPRHHKMVAESTVFKVRSSN